MIFPYPNEWPQYFTATIKGWLPILHTDRYKNIITDSLHIMVQHKRNELNDFVVMNNHIHLIWQRRKQDILRVDFVGENSNKAFE